jgi:DNA-binding NtrC family response regulator
LLLDEVDSLPYGAQGKLLHAVDEREYIPVGAGGPQSFRGRLIVSSNVELEELVGAGQFRADLYYRLNVIEVSVPPLRDRPEEVYPLANQFLREAATGSSGSALSFSSRSEQILQGYHWPGNIRELRNVVQQAATSCTGDKIRVSDLPERIVKSALARVHQAVSAVERRRTSDLRDARVSSELARLVDTLERTGNNRAQAARVLGISRAALYKRLKKFGLSGKKQTSGLPDGVSTGG